MAVGPTSLNPTSALRRSIPLLLHRRHRAKNTPSQSIYLPTEVITMCQRFLIASLLLFVSHSALAQTNAQNSQTDEQVSGSLDEIIAREAQSYLTSNSGVGLSIGL